MEPAQPANEDPRRNPFPPPYVAPQKPRERYWLHAVLFVATVFSTVMAGGSVAGRLVRFQDMGAFWFVPDGLIFAAGLLGFLTVHEFGHYFAARKHGVSTTLPFYIPMPFLGFIGTLGAVIRIRDPIPSTRKLFDIGASGPLAGFVVAAGLLFWALATLPGPDYILQVGTPGVEGDHGAIHAFVERHGAYPESLREVQPEASGTTIVVGETLLYWIATQFFEHVPPMYEMYHYPLLFAAWLGLFFTALNLLPIGQLDGGHILFALFGNVWHERLARAFILLLVVSGAVGFMNDVAPMFTEWSPRFSGTSWFVLAGILYLLLNRIFAGDHRLTAPALLGIMAVVVAVRLSGSPLGQFGYSGWLLFGAITVFLVRVEHPPVLYREPLTPMRRALGYASIAIFLLCFSIRPLYMV